MSNSFKFKRINCTTVYKHTCYFDHPASGVAGFVLLLPGLDALGAVRCGPHQHRPTAGISSGQRKKIHPALLRAIHLSGFLPSAKTIFPTKKVSIPISSSARILFGLFPQLPRQDNKQRGYSPNLEGHSAWLFWHLPSKKKVVLLWLTQYPKQIGWRRVLETMVT